MTEHQQERADSAPPTEYDPVQDMLRATEAALTRAVSPAETEASLAAFKERLRHEVTTSAVRVDHTAYRAALTSSAQTYARQPARAAALGTTALDGQSPPASPGTSGGVRRSTSTSLDELWRSYKSTGDERLREQLILHYSPLVKYV
ncbi:hypothetical protein ABZZ02_27720, partial [Streptomyces sp. NPDC006446]